MGSQFTFSPVAEDYLNKHMTIPMCSLFFEPCATPEQSAFFHRYLLGHLVHTARILERWGESEDLCRVGVFHSLYGTEAFSSSLYPFSTIALERRGEVRGIIGFHTEYLVYSFCAMRRETFLQSIVQPTAHSFFDRFQKGNVPLDANDYRALLLLTIADWIEPVVGQEADPQVEAYVRAYYMQEIIAAAPLLPRQAIQDVRLVYGIE